MKQVHAAVRAFWISVDSCLFVIFLTPREGGCPFDIFRRCQQCSRLEIRVSSHRSMSFPPFGAY
eukprot:6178218-Pleurochrysis_carterae.AAC.2